MSSLEDLLLSLIYHFLQNLSCIDSLLQFFFYRRKEFLGMMTVMRVKVNMVALVFFLCLVYHIIQKGRELRKKGHNLDDCSQDQVIMLRLNHLMEQKEKRDKIDAAALASKS